MPALATSTSQRPKRPPTAAANPATLAPEETSQRAANPSAPAAATSSNVSPAGSRSATATRCPAAASRSARACPIPAAPPVTTAVRGASTSIDLGACARVHGFEHDLGLQVSTRQLGAHAALEEHHDPVADVGQLVDVGGGEEHDRAALRRRAD